MKARIIFHGAAILVLLATVAAAQAPGKPATTAPTGQSADCESSSPSGVSEVTTGNEQARGREVSSGIVRGRRPHESVGIPADKSLGSAYATETLIAFTQADKARGGQMQVVDMTNRYRRGNDKTPKIRPATTSTTTPPSQ
jgi:hypothetical protein